MTGTPNQILGDFNAHDQVDNQNNVVVSDKRYE